MILDKLENIDLYANVNSNFEEAFKFLKDNDLEKLTDGKHEIDSDKVYASVQSYTTKNNSENKWESHEKYIDIQFIVKGKETIAWSPIDQLIVQEEYSKEKDVTFYREGSYSSKINLKENYFCILFPEDAHKPGCVFDEEINVKKIVVKIKL
ncbi:MAG: YhcH/YjgK/YiaL family protein [Clostridium sp.]|uniref:YhcH/YjgK/YiaL family protein n=1 Tax=Clostridium sp. TaxID=1506 RepID=UPI0039EAB5E1